jgi:hypothetical protein
MGGRILGGACFAFNELLARKETKIRIVTMVNESYDECNDKSHPNEGIVFGCKQVTHVCRKKNNYCKMDYKV